MSKSITIILNTDNSKWTTGVINENNNLKYKYSINNIKKLIPIKKRLNIKINKKYKSKRLNTPKNFNDIKKYFCKN